jgi:RNA helicase armi
VDVVSKLSFSYNLDSKSRGGWFNPKLNPSQRAAVYNILMGTARPMPYVIFGPPGTGKTVTMIETILQINKLVPDSRYEAMPITYFKKKLSTKTCRILVATPSNSAADLITEQLINAQPLLQPKELTRLVAFNYRRTVPMYLQKYSVVVKWDGSNDVLSSIANNKITVGTCSSLARLCMQQKQPYYSHVVV